MGDLLPFAPRRPGATATGLCKMHRNLACERPDRNPVRLVGKGPASEIARRRERIARVLVRASGLLDDAERETDRLRTRVLQHAAGCLIALAQEIAGNSDDPLIHGVH